VKHPIQRRDDSRRHTLAHSISTILTSGALLLVGAMASSSAFAQEQATNLDRITVTGSNIPRTNTETPSPVQVVTRQEIDRTGKTTVAEYLQTLTADGAGSIPKTFGNGFAGGGAGISLRGLGAGSTLVLLNGRRMATYGLTDDGQKVFTDLSTIPLDAVERIDILKDGASAIYGSDAIAGVVNIILRNDFQGAILRVCGTRERECAHRHIQGPSYLCEARFHWGCRRQSCVRGHCRKPAVRLQWQAADCWGNISHGYRLFPEADDRKERIGHVLDDRSTGIHQDRGETLSAGQYRAAARDGQEDRLLVDG